VAGGIVVGFFLLAIEVVFKRYNEPKEKEEEISRTALIHWRRKVAVR
jgi:hypothetical protein